MRELIGKNRIRMRMCSRINRCSESYYSEPTKHQEVFTTFPFTASRYSILSFYICIIYALIYKYMRIYSMPQDPRKNLGA